MNIDEFVIVRVLPEHRETIGTLRKLFKEEVPEIQEIISRGIPAFKRKRILAVVSPTKKDITLSFSNGAAFEDKYGLLRGEGNISKHVKINNLETMDREAIRYYIRQAAKLDTA